MALSSDKTAPQTTFVHADPANFRIIVQKLTGAPEIQPLTLSPSPRPSSSKPPAGATPPPSAKHGFKLHERRQTKLDTIQLVSRDSRHQHPQYQYQYQYQYFPYGGIPIVSPVSPLELFGLGSSSTGSPRTPSVLSPKEEEEKAIARKGFYLHPVSPIGGDPPELLPLFPLHSPQPPNPIQNAE